MKQDLISAKSYTPCCEHCLFGKMTADGLNILCEKKGVMLPDSVCRRYEYDPLKRKPKKTPALDSFDESDFTL